MKLSNLTLFVVLITVAVAALGEAAISVGRVIDLYREGHRRRAALHALATCGYLFCAVNALRVAAVYR